MATTSPDNLKTPNTGDQYALVQDLGALADTAQNALTRRANSYVGTGAQRVAFLNPPQGASWTDTNGSRNSYTYVGTSWTRTSGFEVLWSGAPVFVTDTQQLPLASPLSSQPTGLILVWSGYGTAPEDSDWNFTHVPKLFTGLPGTGLRVITYKGSTLANKYVHVRDTNIQGIAPNGTGDARGTCLRYIWGY